MFLEDCTVHTKPITVKQKKLLLKKKIFPLENSVKENPAFPVQLKRNIHYNQRNQTSSAVVVKASERHWSISCKFSEHTHYKYIRKV